MSALPRQAPRAAPRTNPPDGRDAGAGAFPSNALERPAGRPAAPSASALRLIAVGSGPARRGLAVVDAEPASSPILSGLERSVIRLSAGDGRRSLAGPAGPAERLVGWVFGLRRPPPLADPRLEALRRLAVLFRLEGERIDGGEIADFLAHGFTIEQLGAIRALIGATPGFPEGADA